MVDASGNTIFTGWVDSDVNFGGGTLPGAGGGEPYLVKLAGTGAHIWSKTFPGQSGRALATTNAGDVVWAGTFSGDTDLGGAVLSANGSDIFLARFSSSGAHMWSARFGNDYAHPHSLVIDSADRILLAGEFSTSIDFGGETMLAAGLEDGFTALFSGTGEHQWSKRFGSAPDDEVTSVAFDGADNPISAGNTSGSVDFGGGALVSAGSYDVFVGKLGVSGTHVWSRSFGDPQDQRLHALAVGPSDTLILAGRFAGIIDFGGNELLSAADDAFLAALGP